MRDSGAKSAPDIVGPPQFKAPSAWTFRSIMLGPSLKAARGAFDAAYRPTNLRDPLEVEKARQAYSSLETTPTSLHPDIPRTIWMLWQQGWDKAPALVQACAESWKRHNPAWELKLLDEADLDAKIPGYEANIRAGMTRQTKANIVRTALLRRHGGLWVDASLYCSRPLEDWLPQMAPDGFFIFTDPRPYRRVESWFILGSLDNYFISAMQRIFEAYWRQFKREHRYFWMEYLMEHLSKSDPEAARIWERMGKLSALGPTAVSVHALSKSPPDSILRMIDDREIPVHKLNHRWAASDLEGTVLQRLTGLTTL